MLADRFNRVFVAPAGQHSLPNGVNLYGVVYCRIEGNIVASDATKEVVIGGNVVEADPCKLMFHSGNCTLKEMAFPVVTLSSLVLMSYIYF